MAIEIKSVETIEACRAIEAITLAAWGGDLSDAVPAHLLITLARYGGCLLIAREDDRPVGFCLSFLARSADGNLKHHSHMAGVLPEMQGRGIGRQLKWAQAACIRKQGINHVTWTYDPLEARNAHLNLHQLGAVCRTYMPDAYGAGFNALTAGLNTDRFLVDWWLDSPRVAAAEAGSRTTRPRDRELPVVDPLAEAALPPTDRYLVAIPSDIQAIKAADMALARRWRAQTRRVFMGAFARGLTAVDFVRGEGLSYYQLERV